MVKILNVIKDLQKKIEILIIFSLFKISSVSSYYKLTRITRLAADL